MHGRVVTCMGANLLRCVAPFHHDAFRTGVTTSDGAIFTSMSALSRSFEAEFDVLVVGGGPRRHRSRGRRGAARRAHGASITSALETIGQMSCNPAIGGVAKGTVVREVDALGGIMGRATDLATLQFRMLNRGKGPAVWAPRAQCDRGLYRRAVRTLLEAHPALRDDPGHGRAPAVRRRRASPASRRSRDAASARARVVITTGTFLRGRIHIGTDDAHRRRARGRERRRRTSPSSSRRWARGGALQDGNAAAHRRALGATGTRSSARRARSSSSTTRGRTSGRTPRRSADGTTRIPHSCPAGSPSSAPTGKALIADAHRRVGDVRRRDRLARPALLPVGRGQDREVPRRRAASALPRARGARHDASCT